MTASARIKINRAEKHIAEVESICRRFFDSNPYEVVCEHNPETGEDIYRVNVKSDPPDCLGPVAGDALHNLRSALDLLIRQLIVANGETPEKEAFPIFDSETNFSDWATGKGTLRGRISDDAFDVLESLKPYNGGNDTLWALHQLDIIDKHRLVLVVGASFTHTVVSITRGDSTLELPYPMEPRFPLKDGDELTRIKHLGSASVGPAADQIEPKMEPKFAFAIVLNEAGVLETQSLVPALRHFEGAVTEVVDLFAPLV